jgi:hypothetical protein
MSTTYVSIYDLLRVVHTYEAQAAMQTESQSRKRSDSIISQCSTPDADPKSSGPNPLSTPDFSAYETDFTPVFANKKRQSSVSVPML